MLLLSFFAYHLQAQETFIIQGKVVDKETKEPLPAYLMLEEPETGCTADNSGYFKLSVELQKIPQKFKLQVWLIGYKKKEIEARLGEFLSIELELEPIPSHEIVVTADSVVSDERNLKTVTMNKMDVYTLPGTAADPVYTSHILPGVNSLPDASSLLIRGGAPDEVGYFFDGVEVRHPFLSESLHESYFSIFDNQVIENFNVSTSGFSPKYGDALSGVMDITAKDAIFKGEGGIGLSILGLNSYLGLPLKNLGSFIASYNRGYSYLLTKINNRKGGEFQTENAFAKLNLNLDKSNQIRIYGLFDDYLYSEKGELNADSENKIAAISWTSALARNLVAKATFSGIDYNVSYDSQDSFSIRQRDGILQARLDALIDLERHFLEFGADIQRRKIDLTMDSEQHQVQGTRLGAYISDKFRVSDKLFVNLGARIFSIGLLEKKLSFDPRASLASLLTKDDILRFSVGAYHQLGDYFILKRNPELRPKAAVHYALSYDRIKRETELRATLYDKEYRKLFFEDAQGTVSNEGCGYARGAEFFIKKKKKRYDFIFVYNFLRSERKENDVGVLSDSPYEIAHSLTGILKWKFHNGSLGLRYSFASGRPFTPLVGREWDSESETYFPVWGEPNSQRYPSYERMDLNGSKSLNFLKRLVVVYFGITNVLNNKNILRYEYSDDYASRKDQQSIFGRSIFVGIYLPFF